MMGEPEGESVAGGPQMRDEVVVQFRHPPPTLQHFVKGEQRHQQSLWSYSWKVSVVVLRGKASPMEVFQFCSRVGRRFPHCKCYSSAPTGEYFPKVLQL